MCLEVGEGNLAHELIIRWKPGEGKGTIHIHLGKGDPVGGDRRCKDTEGGVCLLFLRRFLEAIVSAAGQGG